ncbi:MAG: hypothetical protein AAFU79_27510 [Myxococcota bacterium]
MTNERIKLDDLLGMLSDDEEASAEAPAGWAEGLSLRLDQTEVGSPTLQDALSLAPEADPELGGLPIGMWLRQESAEALEGRDWSGFGELVTARMTGDEPAEGLDRWLAPEAPSPSVPELLREEQEDQVEALAEAWPRFAAGVAARVSDVSALDQRAIDQLGQEVEAELEAMGPRLDARFWHEVEARLEAGEEASAPAPSWEERFRGWREGLRSGWLWGGTGLAAAAAAVMLFLRVPAPEVAVDAQATLHGEVSLDAVDFEGNVLTIHDDGITVVVLTGV